MTERCAFRGQYGCQLHNTQNCSTCPDYSDLIHIKHPHEEARKMTNKEAAIQLVQMISDLRASGYEDPNYNEAVALACSALLNNEAVS